LRRLCWQYLLNVEKLKPELVVITEPTNMNIYRGHRGRMEIRVEVKGGVVTVPRRSAATTRYTNRPHCARIEKLNERLKGDPFLGKGTVTISEVKSSPHRSAPSPTGGHSSRPPAHAWRDEGERHRRSEGRGEARRLSGCESLRAEIRRSGLHGQGVSDGKILPDLGARQEIPYLKNAVAAYTGMFGKQPFVDSGRSARTASRPPA